MKNYYKILRLKPFSSSEQIKIAYHQLAKKYHPDKNANVSFYSDYFFDIKEAYEFLSDPENKEKYDLIWKNNPEYIEVTDILKKNSSFLKPTKSIKFNKLNIIIIIFFVFSGFLFYLFQTKSKINNLRKELENEKNKNNYISSELESARIANYKILASQKFDINSFSNKLNSPLELADKTIGYPSVGIKKELKIKKDNVPYNLRVKVIFSETEIYIINNNDFTIDKVTISIEYQQNHLGTNGLSDPIHFERKSCLNIQPGRNLVVFGSRNIKDAFVLSCEN